jgi:hypothetical protein
MTIKQDLEKIESLRLDIQYLRIRDNNKTADSLALELQILEDKVKSKSKSKSDSNSDKIDYNEISKYLPPSDDPNTILDDSVIKQRIESALNAKRAEEEREDEIKRQQDDQRKREEFEKRQREKEREENERRL